MIALGQTKIGSSSNGNFPVGISASTLVIYNLFRNFPHTRYINTEMTPEGR
jgi:hypothetical protein